MSAMNEPAVILVPMTTASVRDVFAQRRDPRNTAELSAAEFAEMIEDYHAHGSAWALMAGAVTLAIGGVYVLRARVGEAWCVPTPGIEKYPVSVCKIARMAIEDARRRFALHRIQVAVRADDARALRFAGEFLGFRAEGLMEKYGSDGADYVRFACLK